MSNLTTCVAVLLALMFQPDTAAEAQENVSEPAQSDGDPVDPNSQEDAGDFEYYVVQESDDIWLDEAISQDELPADDTVPDAAGDPAEPGLRAPPGLPLVEAKPTTGAMVRRSLGGVRVADAAAPWQAQIYYPKIAETWKPQIAAGEKPWVLQHYCGGVLVAPSWVLTAAHCIDEGMMRVGYRVRLGQERIDLEGGWTFKIDKVVLHPQYIPFKGGDIALIHIIKDQQQADPPQNQVRPIMLFRGDDAQSSEAVTAFGWGRVDNGANRANAVMLKVGLNIVARPECVKARNGFLIDARVVCAAAPGKKTCSNDSGGPLVNTSSQLVGIVSGGSKSCVDDGVPGVFTRVGAYLPWITQVTGGAVR